MAIHPASFVDPRARLGAGVRVGILQESIILPGVSLTVLRRDLPTVAFTGGGLSTSDGDSLFVDALDIHTTSWRVTAGKHASVLGVVAGMGRDRYTSSSTVSAKVAARLAPPTPAVATGPLTVAQTVDRTNMFVDVNLLFLHAEIGRVSGDPVATYNTFSAPGSSDAKTYFSTGLRFGF